VPAMKLTPNAAMRARDVSRPHAEHLAEAEAAEAGIGGGSRARTGSPNAAKASTGREDAERGPAPGAAEAGAAPAAEDRPTRPGWPRRRRGGGARRGRPAR
jgi:hypothetical protein